MRTIFAAALLLALIPVPASAHCNWPAAHPYCPPRVHAQYHVEPPSPYVWPAPPRAYVAPPIIQYRDQIVRQPIIVVPRTLVVPEVQYAPPQVQYTPPQYVQPQYQPQYAPAPQYDSGGYWGAVVDALEAARRGDQVLN
jgi:hypothetical protein